MIKTMREKDEGQIDIVHEDDMYVVFRNGLRLSKPYAFDFIANVKRRWCEVENERENNIVDIFHKEFPNLPREYYVHAFRDGRLRVEDANASSLSSRPKHKRNNARKKEDDGNENFPALVPGQTVRHLVHKHEPPVLCHENEIDILKEIDDIVAVRKPATVPVHPTGQYRNNSVVEILRRRLSTKADAPPLLPLHRLDRNVSGLLLLAKTSEAAKIATDLIVSNRVRKEYVARVMGLFSKYGETTCEVPLGFCGKTHVASWPRDSSSASSPSYKSAKTSFTLIKHFPESNESLVRCVPETGRTHQIRAHLKILGHPIANDVTYGGRLTPEQSKQQDEYQKMCVSFTLNDDRLNSEDFTATTSNSDAMKWDKIKNSTECPHCPLVCWFGSRATHDLEAIYLHCVKYSFKESWTFESLPLPNWAEDNK